MHRSKAFLICAVLVCGAALAPGTQSWARATPPPTDYNIVLIAINVFRADHLGCYGYERATTPAIDAVADESYLFTNAYAQAGYTLPNMMSIITSLYPASHGVLHVYKDKLSPRVKTMAEVLRLYGYKNAWFSVLQEPHLNTEIGFERGYDDLGDHLDQTYRGQKDLLEWMVHNRRQKFFLAMNIRSTHNPYFPLPRYKDAFKTGRKGNIVESQQEFDQAIYRKILESLDDTQSPMHGVFDPETVGRIKSGEIFNDSNSPDTPAKLEKRLRKIQSLVPEEMLHRLGRTEMMAYESSFDVRDRENLDYLISLYDACILSVDQTFVAPIVSMLKRLGIYEKTVVVITADHGEFLGEKGNWGHGMSYEDPLVRVPLIIRIPHLPGARIDALVQSIDIQPTLLSLVGAQMPFHVQGKSLLPLIRDPNHAAIHSEVYGENAEMAYVRSKEWKLIVSRPELQFDTGAGDILYRIGEKPAEVHNRSAAYPEVVRDLRGKIIRHLRDPPRYSDQKHEFAPHIDPATQERIKKTGYW